MEEKKISEKESLKLIMTMIDQTKTDDGRHSGDTAMESALVELTLCWFFVVIFI